MASKYLQKFPVPAGFQEVLADFTREVLRDQPKNIIEYAAKYFEMLEKGEKFEFDSQYNVKKGDKKYELEYNPKHAEDITKKASNISEKINEDKVEEKAEEKVDAVESKDAGEGVGGLSPVITERVRENFNKYDVNGNGYIQGKQILELIKFMVSDANGFREPSQEQIDMFMQQIDTNYDGKFSFEEVCKFTAKYIQ